MWRHPRRPEGTRAQGSPTTQGRENEMEFNDLPSLHATVRGHARVAGPRPRRVLATGLVCIGLVPAGVSAASVTQDQRAVPAAVSPTNQLPVGVGTNALVGVGVEDLSQA